MQNVAMVASRKGQQDLLVCLRSLMAYRTTCINMHLLVESGMQICQAKLRPSGTQCLPRSQLSCVHVQEDIRAELAAYQDCVTLSCYELPQGEEPRFKGIHTDFSKETLAKLLTPDIIPADVKHVVVVDVDPLFLADICQLAR